MKKKVFELIDPRAQPIFALRWLIPIRKKDKEAAIEKGLLNRVREK